MCAGSSSLALAVCIKLIAASHIVQYSFNTQNGYCFNILNGNKTEALTGINNGMHIVFFNWPWLISIMVSFVFCCSAVAQFNSSCPDDAMLLFKCDTNKNAQNCSAFLEFI